MRSDRDIIAEIASIKSRDVFAPGSERDWTRLDEVSELFFALERGNPSEISLRSELSNHICVSLVAIIQATTRRFIIDVIDAKERSGEALPELRDAKLTLEIARELKNQTITFGELVAHFLPLSSPDSISSAVKYASGEGLFSCMRSAFASSHEVLSRKSTTDEQMSVFTSNLKQLIKRRNEICHEDIRGETMEVETLRGYLITTLHLIVGLQLAARPFTDPASHALDIAAREIAAEDNAAQPAP